MYSESFIKFLGEREITEFTTLKPKHGPQNYEQLIHQHSASHPFRDTEFGHDNGSIGDPSKLFDSARPGSVYNVWKSQGWNGSIEWMRVKDIVAMRPSGLEGNEVIKFTTGSWKDVSHRLDIRQGTLGDCWFVAALSTIACEKELVEFVAPNDNRKNIEAGIYHFRFWFQGYWIDIVVDDYLPVVKLNGGRSINLIGANLTKVGNEASIWVPLAEKAYAKLHDSYQNLAGGQAFNAFENLTGGLVEKQDFQNPKTPIPVDFYPFLKHTFGSRSLLVLSSKREFNGIRAGHAYSITNVGEVRTNRGETAKLVRIRNPWGQTEWAGEWSDPKSSQYSKWNDVSEPQKKTLGLVAQEDGEFWMSYEDMIHVFHSVSICYGTQPGDVGLASSRYAYQDFHGEWNRKLRTTGGSAGNEENNPHYVIDVDGPTPRGSCMLMIQLGLKCSISAPKFTTKGFKVFKALRGQGPPYKQQFFGDPHDSHEITYNSVDGSTPFTNQRLVLEEYRVEPGRYVIVPCTYDEGKEGKFYLRVLHSRKPTNN